MAGKKIGQLVLVVLFSLVLLPLTAEALDVSTGKIVLGRWNANFTAGKKYAEQHNVPMVLLWSSSTCPNCASLKASLDNAVVDAWMDRRQMVMIQDTDGEFAKEFARNNTLQYPYVCVYWPKAGGGATTNRFTGISGHMPVTSGTLAEQFMASVDLFTEGYEGIYKYAEFKVGESESSRLEAVPGVTKFVDVPLIRSDVYAESAAETLLIETYPDDDLSDVTNIVSWAAGETAKVVRVTFPTEFKARAGDKVELALTNAGSGEKRLGSITFVSKVESGLSPVDPLWIGEEFKFGRFTFDYAAATNAVAAKRALGEKAYTLVLFTGALWCPYCKGMETSLLADRAFYDWAESNNVALVEFDQGRASTPATAAGTLLPRLLTYEPYVNASTGVAVSGAGYLSRHSVDSGDAAAEIALTTFYTSKWLAPESTAARLSQPTILLVENDEVKARFTATRNAARVYASEENIKRLGDFILLADGDGESSNYASTTTLKHVVGGASQSAFQISDRVDFYELQGLSAGRLDVSLDAEPPLSPVVISLMAGGKALATGTNGLSAAVSDACLSAPAAYLRLTAYPDTAAHLFRQGVETSAFEVRFTSSIVLVPEERKNYVGAAGDANIEVEAGTQYRLTGFSGEALSLSFSKTGTNLYTANASGIVTLTATAGAAYQKWRPGEVAFSAAKLEVDEADGLCVLAVRREGGSSGDVKVNVAIDGDASDDVPEGRYVWNNVELAWSDGEDGERVAVLKLNDDYVADGVQKLVFTLAKVSGDGVTLSGEPCTVTITDALDKAVAGCLAITGTTPALATKSTLYAGEGTSVTLVVSRVEGAVDAASVRLVPSDSSLAAVPFSWEDGDRVVAREAVFTLPSLAACPSGKVVFSLEDNTIPKAWGNSSVTVVLVAAAAPAFAEQAAEMAFSRYIESSGTIALENIAAGAEVSVVRLSGSLPPGVAASVSSRAFVVSGVPTRCGTWQSVYQLFQTLGGERQPGMTLELSVSVSSPVEEKNESVAAGVARTLSGIPVYNKALKRMTGLLTVTIPPSGRLSAKYLCAAGTKPMVSQNWTACDDSGTASADLLSRDGKYRLALAVKSDGSISGTLVDPGYPYDDLSVSSDGRVWSRDRTADAWKGVYTLAFSPTERISGGEGVAHTGCAAFMLKMSSSSAVRSGKVIVAGRLPNGKSISGSATLVADATGASALLPMFFRSSTDVFAGLPTITANAKEKYEGVAHDHRVIGVSSEAASTWIHADAVTDAASFAMAYTAYGAYYDPEEDLSACLVETEVASAVTLSANVEELTPSVKYGEALADEGVLLSVAPDGIVHAGAAPFSLAFSRAKGTLSGKMPIRFANGAVVTANWFGVVLPGWTGCGCTEGQVDLPFVLGTCWFNDTISYASQEGCTEESEKDRTTTIRRGCSVVGETMAQ